MTKITRIDDAIKNFVQDWIADPLQFSGLSIKTQVRLLSVIVAIGLCIVAYFAWLFRMWFSLGIDGLMFAWYLRNVVYGIDKTEMYADRVAAKHWDGIGLRLFLMGVLVSQLIDVVLSAIDLFDSSATTVVFGFALGAYISICDPKPPSFSRKPAFVLD